MSQEADDLSRGQPLNHAGEVTTRSRRFLSELVERMRPMLKSVAREHAQSVPDCKEDESDIVQRSFVKAIEHIDQFDGQTTGQWRAWLVTIVRNQARDVRRYWSQERRAHSQEECDSHVIGGLIDKSVAAPSKVIDDEESRQRLDRALATLSVQEQQLVRWRLSNYVTYREIAARLKITEPTARRRCNAALLALREAWTKLGA
jgi:RNA polymerase sigma-70 factor, ECF subfamily